MTSNGFCSGNYVLGAVTRVPWDQRNRLLTNSKWINFIIFEIHAYHDYRRGKHATPALSLLHGWHALSAFCGLSMDCP